MKHKIDTGDNSPIKMAPRRIPLAKRADATRCLQEMKEQGIIKESNSPWSAPIVLVKKKDNTTRFCVDYRALNEVTKRDSFPLSRIDTVLDSLAGSTWFSTLDIFFYIFGKSKQNGKHRASAYGPGGPGKDGILGSRFPVGVLCNALRSLQ